LHCVCPAAIVDLLNKVSWRNLVDAAEQLRPPPPRGARLGPLTFIRSVSSSKTAAESQPRESLMCAIDLPCMAVHALCERPESDDRISTYVFFGFHFWESTNCLIGRDPRRLRTANPGKEVIAATNVCYIPTRLSQKTPAEIGRRKAVCPLKCYISSHDLSKVPTTKNNQSAQWNHPGL
jgi:hypothetical protein